MMVMLIAMTTTKTMATQQNLKIYVLIKRPHFAHLQQQQEQQQQELSLPVSRTASA
jgi:hypothetical protein